MKRAFASALIALTAYAGALAGGIRWLETVHDFGAFQEDDGKVSCTFRFVNDGTEPVTVRAARASCGCTTPSFTKHPVEPGDTGIVTATFNPVGRPGRFTKTINLDLSDGVGAPRQTLTIKGVVIGSQNTLRSRYPVDAGPMKMRNRMITFGSVTTGHPRSVFVEVYNASAEPLMPVVSYMPRYLRAAASSDTIAPGEQVVYSVTITPDGSCPYGILTDSLTIDPRNGSEPFTFEVAAIVEEDFSRLTPSQRRNAPVAVIENSRVDFGEFPASEPQLVGSFVLQNRGGSDLLIRRAYSTDAGIEVCPSAQKVKKGKSTAITVKVDPSALPSDILNARVQLITNDPDNPIQIVRVIGIPLKAHPTKNVKREGDGNLELYSK